MEIDMTEREAAIAAKRVYNAHNLAVITRQVAIRELTKLEPYMSAAQLNKFSDFLHCGV